MEDAAPRLQRFVGGKDHGAMAPVPFVDDVEEHVGGVGAVGEVSDFVDDQDSRMRVGWQRVRELAGAKRRGEVVDEGCGGREEGIKAVLNRPIRNGDGEVGLTATGLARQDE